MNKLRAEIGFVFQQFNLYPHLTVINNITLAPTKLRNLSQKVIRPVFITIVLIITAKLLYRNYR